MSGHSNRKVSVRLLRCSGEANNEEPLEKALAKAVGEAPEDGDSFLQLRHLCLLAKRVDFR